MKKKEKEKSGKKKKKRGEKKRKKERKKEGDGLYLKGAPDVWHAPTREARKNFGPFFG